MHRNATPFTLPSLTSGVKTPAFDPRHYWRGFMLLSKMGGLKAPPVTAGAIQVFTQTRQRGENQREFSSRDRQGVGLAT